MSSSKLSASFGELALSVNPTEMYNKASGIEDKIKSSGQTFERMIKCIQETTRYWEGDVADNERKRFENQNENFQKLIANLNNYVTELRMITNIYENSEKVTEAYAQSLQSGILS